MQHEDIAEKIRYILEPISESPSIFYTNKAQFSNEYVELLLQLEARINISTSKEFFWQLTGHDFILPIPKFAYMTSKKKSIVTAWILIHRHSDCAFMVYMRSGRIDEALGGFFERIKDYSSVSETNYQIISCILQILSYEPNLFFDGHLKTIELIISKYQSCINEASNWESKKEQGKKGIEIVGAPPVLKDLLKLSFPGYEKEMPLTIPSHDLIVKSRTLVFNLKEVLKSVRYERIKQELRGVSSQINQDKKQLILKYVDLRFSTLLIEALEKIDTEIEETGSKFSFAKSIGFVRNIYEQSLREIALTIRDRSGKEIPKWINKGSMGEALDYFRKIDFISEKEKDMLTGFSGLISDRGSHSLTSERYEVRIAKNILVEILSYLTDKIDNFLNSSVKNKQ